MWQLKESFRDFGAEICVKVLLRPKCIQYIVVIKGLVSWGLYHNPVYRDAVVNNHLRSGGHAAADFPLRLHSCNLLVEFNDLLSVFMSIENSVRAVEAA